MHSARDSRLDLVTCKSPKDAHEWSMQRRWTITPAGALQDKKSSLAIQLTRGLDLRLSQVVRPSLQSTLFGKKLTLRIPNTPQYIYPLFPWNVESFQREFWERNPKKNKIDSSTIFILWFSKFLYSHHLYCYILERFISQILFSPYPYLWEGFLVLRK